jgi:hypothetical protein
MRLTTNRQKRQARSRGPRIAISQDEITADLNYRGGEPRRAGAATAVRRGRDDRARLHASADRILGG